MTPKQQQRIIRQRHLSSFRLYLSLESGAGSVEDYLDMNAFELREYMESLWQLGMTWENYKKEWCVDHIVALKYFDVLNRRDMLLCWHHSNLIPAFIGHNHAKGYAPEISEKMLLLLPQTAVVKSLIEKTQKHILEFVSYYERASLT